MDRNWIVLGGWGIKPQIMSGIFGNEAHYLDSNTVMPELLDKDGTLKPDWKSIILKYWNRFSNKPLLVAGWSTGAVIAASIANLINPDYLVLLSPTLSFCRKENYRLGVRRSVLQSMIKTIKTNKEKVIEDFLKACGIHCKFEVKYSETELIAGLKFLEQADLHFENKLPSNSIVIHGTDDLIIPVDAGKLFSEQLKCSFFEINGPHAFFSSQSESDRIKNIINEIFFIDNI